MSVSPWMTRMRLEAAARMSAAIWANAVSLPQPGEVTPVRMVTSPVGLDAHGGPVVAADHERAGHRAALGRQLLADAEADPPALAAGPSWSCRKPS